MLLRPVGAMEKRGQGPGRKAAPALRRSRLDGKPCRRLQHDTGVGGSCLRPKGRQRTNRNPAPKMRARGCAPPRRQGNRSGPTIRPRGGLVISICRGCLIASRTRGRKTLPLACDELKTASRISCFGGYAGYFRRAVIARKAPTVASVPSALSARAVPGRRCAMG